MGIEKRSWGSDNSSIVDKPKTQDYLLPSYKSMTEDSNFVTKTTRTKTKTTKTKTSKPIATHHKTESSSSTGSKVLMYGGIIIGLFLLILILSLIFNKRKRAQQRLEMEKQEAEEGKLGVSDYSSNPNYNTVKPQLNTIKPSGPLYSGPVYDPNKEHEYSTMKYGTSLGVATSVEAATLLRKQEQQEMAAKLQKSNTLPNFNSDEQDAAAAAAAPPPPVPQTSLPTSMYSNGYLNIYGQQNSYDQYGSTYDNDYSYNNTQYSYNQSYDPNVSVSNETYEVDRDYIAIYSYEPNMSDELAINVNDRIHLLEMYSDGWGYGKNVTTGQIGVLPLNRLKIEEQTHSTGGYLDPLYQYRKNAESFDDIKKRTVSMNRRPKKHYDDDYDRRRKDRRRYDDDDEDDYDRRRRDRRRYDDDDDDDYERRKRDDDRRRDRRKYSDDDDYERKRDVEIEVKTEGKTEA